MSSSLFASYRPVRDVPAWPRLRLRLRARSGTLRGIVSESAPRLPIHEHDHAVRLVHTSDVHVGTGFGADADGREAALRYLDRIMTAAVELDAQLVLVAGDLFDHNRVKEPVVAETARILGGGPPVVILPGNHDPFMAGSMYERFAHHFPGHVHILRDAEGELLHLPGPGVQIWGQAHASYDDFAPAVHAPRWQQHVDRPHWRIAMAHGSSVDADGRLSFGYRIESEHLAGLDAHYVALGHLDRHGAVGPDGTTAYYSGSPGLLGGFTLVDLRPGGVQVRPILFESLGPSPNGAD